MKQHMTKKVSKKKKTQTEDDFENIEYDIQQWSKSDVKELLEETQLYNTYNYSRSSNFDYEG